MKIAYIASAMNLTFVINELEAHEEAGWEVLPLASCKPHLSKGLSEIMTKWHERTVYRTGIFDATRAALRETVTHPVRFLKVCSWLLSLLVQSPVEFAKAVYELATACYFAEQCRFFGVKHIHVHFASRSLSLGLMLATLIDVPVSCTVHAFDIFVRSPKSLVPRLTKCCFIASISNFNIEYLRKTCGEKVSRLCRLVHCGVDLEKFRAVDRCPKPGCLLSICNLELKKGLDVAIKACAKLRDENIDFHFQIVGDGEQRAGLEKLIVSMGLRNRVELLGHKPNDQLVPLLSEACAFVLPSIRTADNNQDGIPVAMMEAMACEIPAVSTNISGIPELVKDGVCGYLVPEGDVDALTEALRRILSDMDLVEKLGKAGREQVRRNFNIDHTAAQIRNLIVSVLGC
jgi:glycosyltransferase involved in cell wall biosynthesis